MQRFAFVVAFFLAAASAAQTLSDPQPLTAAPTRTPSFRNTTSVVAARTRDGFLVVWKEDGVLRMKRLSPQGDITGESAMETTLGPSCMAANGDEALVSVVDQYHPDRSYLRIHADGRMTTIATDSGSSSLVAFADGYLGMFGGAIVRLDLDGRVLARLEAKLSSATLVAADGGALLLSCETNVLHASTIRSDLTMSPDLVLSNELEWSAPISATVDPSGELAVATITLTGSAVLFFDSHLRSSGRVALPSSYHPPTIASSGKGYVIVLPNAGDVTIDTIDAHRHLDTVAVIPAIRPSAPPVSGIDGALLACQSTTSPSLAQFVIAGGTVSPRSPRLLADAVPDQRWPRIARIGDRVVIAWDESKGTDTTLMAAIFDPYERRVVTGPVAVAHGYLDDRGDELGVASNGSTIAITWANGEGAGMLYLLSPDLQTIASKGQVDLVHDVTASGADYVTARGSTYPGFDRWSANGTYAGTTTAQTMYAVSPYTYTDARVSIGPSDVLLVAHNWYQLLCGCGEGPWRLAVMRFADFGKFGNPATMATANLFDQKKKMSGFARAGDRLLLFFPQKTEVLSNTTLQPLVTIPNDRLTQELPYRSIGQAAVVGNGIIGTFGSVVEFFTLDGTPISTLPLDETANDSQFAAGWPFVIVDDALTSSGSRRINVRLLDTSPVHHRAAGH